jgi:hypothetical protein
MSQLYSTDQLGFVSVALPGVLKITTISEALKFLWQGGRVPNNMDEYRDAISKKSNDLSATCFPNFKTGDIPLEERFIFRPFGQVTALAGLQALAEIALLEMGAGRYESAMFNLYGMFLAATQFRDVRLQLLITKLIFVISKFAVHLGTEEANAQLGRLSNSVVQQHLDQHDARFLFMDMQQRNECRGYFMLLKEMALYYLMEALTPVQVVAHWQMLGNRAREVDAFDPTLGIAPWFGYVQSTVKIR